MILGHGIWYMVYGIVLLDENIPPLSLHLCRILIIELEITNALLDIHWYIMLEWCNPCDCLDKVTYFQMELCYHLLSNNNHLN